jgi:acetylornithine deacetylase/succinyl-diaminopimelate desuccinylase-like protein
MTRHTVCALIVVAAAISPAVPRGQTGGDLRGAIEAWVVTHQRPIVNELADLVSIPNIAADRANLRKNATHLRDLLARHGLRAEILETDGNPLVYGELTVPGASRTLLVYEHYDGQPVDSAKWKDSGPFAPILRDGRLEDGAKVVPGLRLLDHFDPQWRIYARSVSDDKGPIIALLAALDALKAAGRSPSWNLRVMLDGEEEAGSPSLGAVIPRYREKLTGDLLLIFDGPLHPTGRPTLVFGARGNMSLELTVYGPKVALHSGHYGNWAPNPAMRLAQLLASMKDRTGRVIIEGFYDGLPPLPPEEQALLDAVPDDAPALMRVLGIAEPETPGMSLQDSLQYPSLNIHGMGSDLIGPGARNVIPDRATALLDLRLPKESRAGDLADKIRLHVVKQGYHIVTEDPDDETRTKHPRIVKMVARESNRAFRTSPLAPESRMLADTLARVSGQPPVLIRTFGASLPLAPLIDQIGCPAISVSLVNYDNNQHGDNENLRLGHLFDGVFTIAAILTMGGGT